MFENTGNILCLFDDGSKFAYPCGGRSFYESPKGRRIIVEEMLPQSPEFVLGSQGKILVGTKFLTDFMFFTGTEKEFQKLQDKEWGADFDPWPPSEE